MSRMLTTRQTAVRENLNGGRTPEGVTHLGRVTFWEESRDGDDLCVAVVNQDTPVLTRMYRVSPDGTYRRV